MTRRVISWVVLGLYGLVASGLPLPLGSPPAGERVAAARLAAKDRSRPFPCMDKACGCATAEQCFTSCCCHTPAEQLAWAKAHNLEPAVLASLQARVAPRAAAHDEALDEALCGDNDVCRDYQSLAADPIPGGCDSGGCHSSGCHSPGCGGTTIAHDLPAAAEPEHDDGDETPPRTRVVILRAMLACGGIAAEWAAAGIAVLPDHTVGEYPLEPTGTAVLFDTSASGVRTAPAAPPPRA